MDALLRIALALARARVPAAEFAWLLSDAASSKTATTPNITVRCIIPKLYRRISESCLRMQENMNAHSIGVPHLL